MSQKATISKPWGTSTPLYLTSEMEVVKISILKTGHCSRHRHLNKDNTFIVLRGELLVIEEPGSLAAVQHPLDPCSKPLTIPRGVLHKFWALTDVEAIEIYRAAEGTTIDPDDIIRYSEGGLLAPQLHDSAGS